MADFPNWKGPLSLSFGYDSGDYLNTNVARSSADQEVLEAIATCRGLLKKKKQKGSGFSIGWHDLDTDIGSYTNSGHDPAEVLGILDALERFVAK